jgi:hypothetical protein
LRRLSFVAVVLVAAVPPANASASQLIDRDAAGVTLAVNAKGEALLTYGLAPNAQSGVWELRLSHWSGPLAELTIDTDWSWHQWDHLYGTFTYNGKPQYGFKSKPSGEPLDTFGCNVYVDTFDSAYGPGWKRENSFLVHTSTGAFCYSVNPHRSRPAAKALCRAN